MSELKISIGEYSSKGRKDINQDFHDILIPREPQLSSKGIAVALSDGISSSDVSQIASKTSVTSFLMDYFSTPETWTVKKSAQRVISATNSWLFSQSRQSKYHYDKNRGYVCTFSAMVLRSNTAYLFHLGDSRIYRLRDDSLEQLTEDHRVYVSSEQSYLSRALGIDSNLMIDYDTLQLEEGDTFLFMTDGVYEFVSAEFLKSSISEYSNDLQNAAKQIALKAYDNESDDNLTIQIVKVDSLPSRDAAELQSSLVQKPLPPVLDDRELFEGYKIIDKLHSSSRSHVYLAHDIESDEKVVLKTPSIDLGTDKAYIERFMMEEWISTRLNNTHLLKSYRQTRKRNYLYNITEYIEGQTLTQWMIDNPKPKLEIVRSMAEQIAKGLLAMHRQEMIHQDLRPHNIMIDMNGTIKIIDFGATRVDGIAEINTYVDQEHMLGTAQYSAPEYFLGLTGSSRSDMFSLAVIVYEMLSGKFPYGVEVARSTTKSLQKKLKYRHLDEQEDGVPIWVDETLKKALDINPYNRYDELSEFLYDLRHPNGEFLKRVRPPFYVRSPEIFWKIVSIILFGVIVYLLNR